MATAAQSFSQTWRIGRTVREVAAPHRTGRIRSVGGTGPNARITVNLSGGTPTTFRPAQLTPL
jgi:hypothetical protein